MTVQDSETPVSGFNFNLTYGSWDNGVEFKSVDIPDKDIEVNEKQRGDSAQRKPTHVTGKPNYGGSFTISTFSQVSRDQMEKLVQKSRNEKSSTKKELKVILEDSKGNNIVQWSFEGATIEKQSWEKVDGEGNDIIDITYTISYQKVTRERPWG